MQMDINKQPQPRPLSFSSYHSSQAYQSPLPDIKNFINPESEKTPQVIMTHWQRQFYSNQRFHESFKTVMCQNWLERAQCHYGRYCRYAHGLHELRQSTVPLPINSKYKTRLCDKYTNLGICPYGNRCLFIHPEDQQELKNSPNATTEGDEMEMPLLPSQPPAPPPNTPLSSRVLEPKQRPLDSPVLPAKAQQRHLPVPLASINASNNPFTNSLPSSLFNMRSYRKQTLFAIPQRTRGRNLLPPEIQEELIREMKNITPSATPKQFLDEEQEEPMRASAHQPTGLLRPILPFEASSSKFFSSWTDKDSNNFGASYSTANQSSMFAPLPASSSTNVDNANTQLPSTSSSFGNNKCKWTTDPQQHEMERLVDTLIASPIIAVNSNSNQL